MPCDIEYARMMYMDVLQQAGNTGPILELIYRLKVSDVMTPNPETISVQATMREAQKKMRDRGITGLPVLDDGRLVGIVSIGDIIDAFDAGEIDAPVKNFMTTSVVTLEDDMPLSYAITYVNKYQYRRYPVINKTGTLMGIITATDIIKALLVEMNAEFTKLEAIAKNDVVQNTNECGILESLQFPTVKYDFEHAGTASTELKNTLKKYGFANTVIRRASIVSYELELNQIIHSDGGYMQYTISTKGVEILARDRGPGIQDIQLALREGFSTANDWIRSIGFGAGLGLPNARKSSDEFSIDSSTRGTLVRAFIFAQPREL